jgi:hypothetical protein
MIWGGLGVIDMVQSPSFVLQTQPIGAPPAGGLVEM